MIYQYKQIIPFTSAGRDSHLTLAGCIDLFQDAANFHTRSVVSQEYLETSNRVWILNYWQILFDKPCHYNDTVTISTWSSGADRMFAHRYYTIENEQQETCIRALSYWFLMDRVRMRPVRITPRDLDWYAPSPGLDLGTENRKIALPEGMQPRQSIPVWRCTIDGNGHVNNGWYVRIAAEFFPEDKPVKQLRVEYRTAAHLGDTFYPAIFQDDCRTVVALNDPAGKPYAIVEALF